VVPGDVRLAQLPDVPTMRELGLSETGIIPTAYGVFAPAGTAPEVIARLQREFSAIIRSPELKGRLETSALLPGGEGRERFAAYLAAERKRVADIVEALQVPKVE
jgi:tripartite-type tricarboxylate transporter receptor subunit TctC